MKTKWSEKLPWTFFLGNFTERQPFSASGGFLPFTATLKFLWFVHFLSGRSKTVYHTYVYLLLAAQFQILRLIAVRHYCFHTCFFKTVADKRQSTFHKTVKTNTCREWIICSVYTLTLGWVETHLEIATPARSVWMHTCQMIHQTWGKGFISSYNVTLAQQSRLWFFCFSLWELHEL